MSAHDRAFYLAEAKRLAAEIGRLNPHSPLRRKTESGAAYRRRRLEESWARHVFMAVHDADPWFRNEVAHSLFHTLRSGQEMPKAGAEWLQFVLATLIEQDRVPTAYVGRPVTNADSARSFRRRLDLADYVLKREKSHPNEKVIDRLHAAAAAMNTSFATIKGIYYSRVFREYFADLRRDSK